MMPVVTAADAYCLVLARCQEGLAVWSMVMTVTWILVIIFYTHIADSLLFSRVVSTY